MANNKPQRQRSRFPPSRPGFDSHNWLPVKNWTQTNCPLKTWHSKNVFGVSSLGWENQMSGRSLRWWLAAWNINLKFLFQLLLFFRILVHRDPKASNKSPTKLFLQKKLKVFLTIATFLAWSSSSVVKAHSCYSAVSLLKQFVMKL